MRRLDRTHCDSGWTKLIDLDIDRANEMAAGWDDFIADRINAQFPGRNRWRAGLNIGVQGVLTVRTYKAFDDPGRTHGAEYTADLKITRARRRPRPRKPPPHQLGREHNPGDAGTAPI